MGGLLLLSQKNSVGLADLDKRNKNDHILAKRLISGFNSICIKVLAITEISTYLPKKKKCLNNNCYSGTKKTFTDLSYNEFSQVFTKLMISLSPQGTFIVTTDQA